MMRLLVGLLIVANGLLFLYGYLGLARQTGQPPAPRYAPDFGSIRILAAADAPVAVSPAVMEEESGDADGSPSMQAEEQPQPLAAESREPQAEAPVTSDAGPEPVDELAGSSPSMMESAETTETNEGPAAPEQMPPTAPTAQAPSKASPVPDEETAGTAQETAPPEYCGTIGPLRNRPQARRLKRKLGSPPGVSMETKPQLVDKAYWVLIPPLPSRDDARAMVKRLRDADIEDLWLVPKGELRNAISLGLFSRRDAAYAHAERLRGLGFEEVEIRPKQEEVQRYWLNFSGLSEETLERLPPELLPKGAAIVRNPCPKASAAP